MTKFSLFSIIVLIFSTGCGRKVAPSFITKTVRDTVTIQSVKTDTIPCDDFEIYIENEIHDTVYLKVVDKVVTVKYVKVRDTILKETIVVVPRKNVTKIDNSVKAKKGSIIGNDNVMTTKKNNWWWIFLAGMLTWFIIQNVLIRVLKTYFPFLRFLP